MLGPLAPTVADPDDGAPVWVIDEGSELLPGLRALEDLGAGHRCQTVLAWSVRRWQPVVAKLPRPHQVEHPRARVTLERERAGVLAGAGHPTFPALVEDRLDDALPHLLMQYLDGPSLADVVDDAGPLAAPDVALLGVTLLPALMLLHRAGLAHLDVKPENVLLPDGRPVLIDFGSARELGRPQPPGRPVGTTGYAAPEMEACASIATSMDLYGLGTVLVEAQTARPFPESPEPPDGPLHPVVTGLLDPDPTLRWDAHATVAGLLEVIPPEARPWPTWLDRELTSLGGRQPGGA